MTQTTNTAATTTWTIRKSVASDGYVTWGVYRNGTSTPRAVTCTRREARNARTALIASNGECPNLHLL